MGQRLRIGIDLGGTKISGIALDRAGSEAARHRVPAPREDYDASVRAIAEMVRGLEARCAGEGVVGIGMPGSISPATGLVQNANSVWLNGRPFQQDLDDALGRPVKLANDADCFALSEATDGAGAGARTVFGAILGTGCGAGIVVDGALLSGPHATAGEWGHTPLPWAEPSEHPGRQCWCGRQGCIETWVSGPALEHDHRRETGEDLEAHEIEAAAQGGDEAARATLERHAHRLARALAMIVDVVDPHVIVLGGGLSNLGHLYRTLPALIAPHVFADHCAVKIVAPKHGDDSGVRGAAWLWNET